MALGSDFDFDFDSDEGLFEDFEMRLLHTRTHAHPYPCAHIPTRLHACFYSILCMERNGRPGKGKRMDGWMDGWLLD